MNITKHLLTRPQEDSGFIIEETEHTVILKFKDVIVNEFSGSGLTIQSIRNAADNYLNGIQFAVPACFDCPAGGDK